MLWWFQATHRGYHLLETLTLVPLRQWSPRRFWGVLYPLSYILGMGYLVLIIGREAWTMNNLLVMVVVSAAWWGIWGFLAWAWCNCSVFWRRRKS